MKLSVIIAVLLTIIDQISKLFITRLMNVKHSIKIIDNFFYLTYTHNQGAAFSILTGQRIFLIIITILIIILLLSYLKKNFPKDKLTKFSFALITSAYSLTILFPCELYVFYKLGSICSILICL